MNEEEDLDGQGMATVSERERGPKKRCDLDGSSLR